MSSVTDIYTKHYSEERKKQFEDRVREMEDGVMSEESIASMVAEEFRTGKKSGGRMGFRNGMGTKKGIMQISENQTDFENPDYYKNTIEDMLKDYESEEMSNLIQPFSMGYLMRSVSDYIEKGGDPSIAADLQIRVQDFINTQSENFQKLPKAKQDILRNKKNKDFEENKNIIPGLPDNTDYKTVEYEEAKNGGRMGFKDGNGVADKSAQQKKFSERVIKLMDEEGYDFGEAVKEAMKEGYATGGRIGFNEGLLVDAPKNKTESEVNLSGNFGVLSENAGVSKSIDQQVTEYENEYMKKTGKVPPMFYGDKYRMKLQEEFLKNKPKTQDMATGGRAGYYGGGQAMVGEDLSEIGHGSDSLMARNMQLAPNSMATTSTGLNYLLGQDNDTARVPYKDAGPVILPKPKPKNFSKTLDMLNTKAAANILDTKTYANLVGEFAKKAFDNGELSEVEYMRIIQPLFGQVGEMVTNQIQDDQNYLEKYADGGRTGYKDGIGPKEKSMEPGFETNDPKEAAKEIIKRLIKLDTAEIPISDKISIGLGPNLEEVGIKGIIDLLGGELSFGGGVKGDESGVGFNFTKKFSKGGIAGILDK